MSCTPWPNISNPRFIFLTCKPQRQQNSSQSSLPFYFTLLIFLFLYSKRRPRKISYKTTETDSTPLNYNCCNTSRQARSDPALYGQETSETTKNLSYRAGDWGMRTLGNFLEKQSVQYRSSVHKKRGGESTHYSLYNLNILGI